jgi:hypothetical protein
MPRPSVSEELKSRLEDTVADRADVPAHHLTFEQKVAYILDELERESESDSGFLS